MGNYRYLAKKSVHNNLNGISSMFFVLRHLKMKFADGTEELVMLSGTDQLLKIDISSLKVDY